MYRIGVDLGGTNIAVGIVNEAGEITEKLSVKTKAPRPANEIVSDIADTINTLLKNNNLTLSDISCAGIGVPGAVDSKSGSVSFSNNLQFFSVPLGSLLKEKVGIPFLVANDANAAAFGEFMAGSGKNTENFITITLGTGIGSGIIINKRLYTGGNGAAAEIGHMKIASEGIPCSCGRTDCFEKYASATALVSQTRAAMEKYPDSLMWELCDGDKAKANGKTAFIAMHKGDKAGIKVIEDYVRFLAMGVINVINIFQPDVLSIGGGISGSGDDIIIPLKKHIEKEDYARFTNIRTEIKTATLGNDAGIIGAAFLDKA